MNTKKLEDLKQIAQSFHHKLNQLNEEVKELNGLKNQTQTPQFRQKLQLLINKNDQLKDEFIKIKQSIEKLTT